MKGHATRILLVEDNPGDARLIREMLAEAEDASFEIDWVSQLSAGLEKLGRGEIDVVLLDLGLPDSRGLDTFVKAYSYAPQIPFVVLTGLNDESVALTAVREGAQDFLVKGQTDGGLLLRAIRYATERKKIEEDLRWANEELRREIEERQAAELAVEAERQRLFAVLDALPGLVYLKAPDFSLKFANRLFREICGDWEGKKCYEAIFNREKPCEQCTHFTVLKTGKPRVKEATFADSKQTYQVYSYPFADVDGASLVLTLGIDISERKRAEEALRQSEARLAKAQRLAHLGSWEWDLISGKVIWSEEVYRIFGVDPHKFTPALEMVLNSVHPEDEARVRKALNEALAGAKPFNLVSRRLRPNGSVRYLHSQAEVIFEENGQPRRMVGTVQDITERRTAEMRLRESEERFRAVFESAAIGIALTKINGEFISVNKAYQKMSGYWEEELRGKTWQELTHADDRNKNLELYEELESGQRDHFQLEKRYRGKNGRYFWGRVTVSLVKDFQGKPLYTIGMVEDISQAKQAGEKLQESEEKLRHLASQLFTAQEDERKRISRELHDELGQALLLLKLQTGAIKEGLQPEQQQLREECLEMLGNLDQAVDNIRRLSRDLSPMLLEDLGLSAALRHLIAEFGKRYQVKYSFQETDIDDLFPLATQTAIYRIVQESLTNIGKHSQADLLLVAIAKRDDQVSILIQDNGKGFDSAQLRRQSSGMGLAAMEERARMVGGVLSVWTQEGAGTKISLDIPYSAKPK